MPTLIPLTAPDRRRLEQLVKDKPWIIGRWYLAGLSIRLMAVHAKDLPDPWQESSTATQVTSMHRWATRQGAHSWHRSHMVPPWFQPLNLTDIIASALHA